MCICCQRLTPPWKIVIFSISFTCPSFLSPVPAYSLSIIIMQGLILYPSYGFFPPPASLASPEWFRILLCLWLHHPSGPMPRPEIAQTEYFKIGFIAVSYLFILHQSSVEYLCSLLFLHQFKEMSYISRSICLILPNAHH